MRIMTNPHLTVVAHNLSSLHNVGAIFRTADAAGFHSVITSGYTGSPPDKRIAKVALGAEESMHHEKYTTIDALLDSLEDHTVILLEQDPNSIALHQLTSEVISPSSNNVTLIVCDEVMGAPDELRERADIILELPMRGMKESLNVSVAFGIAAYAVANLFYEQDTSDLKSRCSNRVVRPGVLTRGRTSGETPDR